MCKDCGCGDSLMESHGHEYDVVDHEHVLPDGTLMRHSHSGDNQEGHHHHHRDENTIVVELGRNVLSRNEDKARANRRFLNEKGITAINIISSPGSGKTTLLEKTLQAVSKEMDIAVITGDQRTDNDARRISKYCGKVVQIETLSSCHLSASQISDVLESVTGGGTRLLFIENVGNMVCPVAFDLGESFKMALLSVAEGEDKPLKYPSLFAEAGIVLITKTDLLPHLDFDIEECRKNIRKINPGVSILEISAKTGDGMEKWIAFLKSKVIFPPFLPESRF